MTDRDILVELLPQEREVILRCILTPEVRDQLQPLAASPDVEAIRLDRGLVHWIAGDLSGPVARPRELVEGRPTVTPIR